MPDRERERCETSADLMTPPGRHVGCTQRSARRMYPAAGSSFLYDGVVADDGHEEA